MKDGLGTFSFYLLERWRAHLFNKNIFPGFPFRPTGWKALAFNRDNHGARLPLDVWQKVVVEFAQRTNEKYCFVMSSDPIVGGSVMSEEQPFIIPLDAKEIESHFRNSARYLPEFFMAGASEEWAVWGDSDITVLGGKAELMSVIATGLGGWEKILEMMKLDFGLTESSIDDQMRSYLEALHT